MTHENEEYVPRVTQLDSVELDKEIIQVLKTQLSKITDIVPGSTFATLEPEINALLRFYIWKFSVHQFNSTFGQQLLNLQYESKLAKFKSFAWCFLFVVPSYLQDRLSSNASLLRKITGFDVISKSLKWMPIVLRVLVLWNLLKFLKDGRYPSLVDRILQIPLKSSSKQPRSLGYSYMTRELLWHTLIEIMGNVIPLLNYYSIQRKFLSIISKPDKKSFKNLEPVFQLGDKCTICKESPILPHHLGCSHIFCFYCIEGNLLANRAFECPACGYSQENLMASPVPFSQPEHTLIM